MWCFIHNLIKYRLFYYLIKNYGQFIYRNSETEFSKDIDLKNKKVIIYGFGPYGEEKLVDLFHSSYIVGIYDQQYKKMSHHVKNPDKIIPNSFDFVVVTVMNENIRQAVIEFLKNKKVSSEQIIYLKYCL